MMRMPTVRHVRILSDVCLSHSDRQNSALDYGEDGMGGEVWYP